MRYWKGKVIPGSDEAGIFDSEGYKLMASHETLIGAENYQKLLERNYPGVYLFKTTNSRMKAGKKILLHATKYMQNTWIKII